MTVARILEALGGRSRDMQDASAWAVRLFLGREPTAEEIAIHAQHPTVDLLRLAMVQTESFRRYFQDSNPDQRRYRIPLFLLRPPADPALPFRFEPPSIAHPTSQLCTAEQFDEPDYAAWCRALAVEPVRHRKQWEFCYILGALQAAGVMMPGAHGLGFGTGREPLPSLFAARGIRTLATDAPPDLDATQGWATTNQHSQDLADLHWPSIVPRDVFLAHADWRAVDMNAIPADLTGFDFCWSACAFEHLGSIAHGLDFVANSLRCLRPGGVAVHTTEFNLSSNDATLEHPGLCLFRRRDMEALLLRLLAEGHDVWPLNLHPGFSEVDEVIDAPPFGTPHLKLLSASHVTTSIGLVVRRRG